MGRFGLISVGRRVDRDRPLAMAHEQNVSIVCGRTLSGTLSDDHLKLLTVIDCISNGSFYNAAESSSLFGKNVLQRRFSTLFYVFFGFRSFIMILNFFSLFWDGKYIKNKGHR